MMLFAGYDSYRGSDYSRDCCLLICLGRVRRRRWVPRSEARARYRGTGTVAVVLVVVVCPRCLMRVTRVRGLLAVMGPECRRIRLVPGLRGL